MITLKTPQEIKKMREGGKILVQILQKVARKARPGAKASDLNVLAEKLILEKRAKASFKNYQGFPAALCVSVNSEVVHGVPGKKVICKGDVVGLDLGVKYKNLYTDAAITVIAGRASPKVRNFVQTCKEALDIGILKVKPGNHIGDISSAIQNFVERKGYAVVKDLVGHGIGYKVHEEPRIPNYGQKGEGVVLKEGMTFCIEPMINLGDSPVRLAEDGYTFRTQDQSLSAHFEHTVAVTKKGYAILTA